MNREKEIRIRVTDTEKEEVISFFKEYKGSYWKNERQMLFELKKYWEANHIKKGKFIGQE